MRTQNCLSKWLDVVRQQAITWANVDPVQCRHMVLLGHNEIKHHSTNKDNYTDLYKIKDIKIIKLVNDNHVNKSTELYIAAWQISLASLSDCLGLAKVSYMEKRKQCKESLHLHHPYAKPKAVDALYRIIRNQITLRNSNNKNWWLCQGSKLRGAEGQNAPKLSPNAPRLLNLGAKFCYPIQPDIWFEA